MSSFTFFLYEIEIISFNRVRWTWLFICLSDSLIQNGVKFTMAMSLVGSFVIFGTLMWWAKWPQRLWNIYIGPYWHLPSSWVSSAQRICWPRLLKHRNLDKIRGEENSGEYYFGSQGCSFRLVGPNRSLPKVYWIHCSVQSASKPQNVLQIITQQAWEMPYHFRYQSMFLCFYPAPCNAALYHLAMRCSLRLCLFSYWRDPWERTHLMDE